MLPSITGMVIQYTTRSRGALCKWPSFLGC